MLMGDTYDAVCICNVRWDLPQASGVFGDLPVGHARQAGKDILQVSVRGQISSRVVRMAELMFGL